MQVKILLPIAILVLALNFAFSNLNFSGSSLTVDQPALEAVFVDWIAKYQKNYKDDHQKVYRFIKFKQNYDLVQKHNQRFYKGEESYDVELNQFADFDHKEHLQIYIQKVKSNDRSVDNFCKKKTEVLSNLPNQVDWESKKKVTPVRNQGICNCGYAFAAVGALQGLNAIQNNKLQVFSVQQIVDCDIWMRTQPYGCGYTTPDPALRYVIDNGITLDSKYPYIADVQNCRYTKEMKTFQVSDCAYVPANSTKALQSAVVKQPVAVQFDPNNSNFVLYKSGVFTTKHQVSFLYHSMTLVGYGKTILGKQYWKVKNSWSSSWGMDGYALIHRADQQNVPGTCGILMGSYVPIL